MKKGICIESNYFDKLEVDKFYYLQTVQHSPDIKYFLYYVYDLDNNYIGIYRSHFFKKIETIRQERIYKIL